MLSSIALNNGVLQITGDANSYNFLEVELVGNNDKLLAVANGTGETFALSSVHSIQITGGQAGNRIYVNPHVTLSSTLTGGAGNDTIIGGGGKDSILGGGGNDSLRGCHGNDTILGGDGRDTIRGGFGNDLISSTGQGTVTGGPGSNTIHGSTGEDTINSSSGSDTIQPTVPVSGSTTGDPTDNSTPPTTLTGSSMLPVIQFVNPSGLPGGAIQVNAVDSVLTDGTILTTQFNWDFGDPSGAHNTLTGFNAAHIYNQAGTYTITLSVTQADGSTATTSASVTISPDTRQTLYVSNDGNDANSGLSPDQAVATLNRAKQLLTDNTRLLFQCGDTFYITTAGLYLGYSNVYVGNYGTGANPVLYDIATAGASGVNMDPVKSNNVVINGLTFDSMYTPVNGVANKIPFEGIWVKGSNITISNCEFLNVTDAINMNSEPNGVMIQDCTAPLDQGVRGYFIWSQGTNVVVVGNSCANVTREHVFRTPGTTLLLVEDNDFTNLDQSTIDSGDQSKSTITVHKGSYVYIADNTLTDGDIALGPLEAPVDTDPKSMVDWAVVENNQVNQSFITDGAGTDNVMIRDNVVDRDAGVLFYVTPGLNNVPGRIVQNLTIENNTGISTATASNFLKVQGHADGISLIGNLFVDPNLVTGSNASAPVFVIDNDLSGFTTISGNVWPVPAAITRYADGGINYVWSMWSNGAGYQTPTEWNNLTQVHGDLFQNVTLSGNYQVTIGSVTAGSNL